MGLEQKREARKDLLHEIYSLLREDLENFIDENVYTWAIFL